MKLKENFISTLMERLQSYKAWEKLRTCVLFKQDMKFEPYLNGIKNKKYRVMLSKFTWSAHDPEIKRRRYDKNQLTRGEILQIVLYNNNLAMGKSFIF